jgi:hypothetical protein
MMEMVGRNPDVARFATTKLTTADFEENLLKPTSDGLVKL